MLHLYSNISIVYSLKQINLYVSAFKINVPGAKKYPKKNKKKNIIETKKQQPKTKQNLNRPIQN